MERTIIKLLLLLLLSNNVLAEVSDKMASVEEMWAQTILISLISFFVASKKWWLSIVGISMSLVIFLGIQDMQNDKYFNQAVINELGNSYYIHSYSSLALILIATISGATYSAYKANKINT